MKIPTLTTPRLVMRPLTLEDLQPLFDILQEPNIFQYFPRTENPSMDRVEKIIKFQIKQYEQFSYGTWAVELRHEPQLIGWCGLNYLPETDEEEVAYLLSHAYHGKGYATEAAIISLAYGFQQIGLNRIICLMHPENIASRRVAEKIGMTYLDNVNYWDMELMRYEKLKDEEGQ